MTGPAHWHCPNDCEKPQPFSVEGTRFCGRCWHERNDMVPCIFCTPDTCPGDA